jgi:3-hydroxyisobutyrate dehydrogenase-like beta-hydroxyacid dehydrogenase
LVGAKRGALVAGIINTSSGASWSCGTYNPVPGVLDGVPSSNDYKGGFGSALMLKDVGLALDAAKVFIIIIIYVYWEGKVLLQYAYPTSL